jgi:hypothetical protein
MAGEHSRLIQPPPANISIEPLAYLRVFVKREVRELEALGVESEA